MLKSSTALGQAPAPRPCKRSLADRLTDREKQIANMIGRGLPNKAVAAELGISKKTVEKHRIVIYLKLGVHDVVSFTHLVLALGLVAPLFVES